MEYIYYKRILNNDAKFDIAATDEKKNLRKKTQETKSQNKNFQKLMK